MTGQHKPEWGVQYGRNFHSFHLTQKRTKKMKTYVLFYATKRINIRNYILFSL